MLRFKILASAVPLLIVAFFARGGLLPGPRPCIAVGEHSVEIASVPWIADLHVAFTDDPALATVRVQLFDNAEAADFAVVDDVDSAEGSACRPMRQTQFVAISASPSRQRAGDLSVARRPGRLPDLRQSKTLQHAEAAALIVGASGGQPAPRSGAVAPLNIGQNAT